MDFHAPIEVWYLSDSTINVLVPILLIGITYDVWLMNTNFGYVCQTCREKNGVYWFSYCQKFVILCFVKNVNPHRTVIVLWWYRYKRCCNIFFRERRNQKGILYRSQRWHQLVRNVEPQWFFCERIGRDFTWTQKFQRNIHLKPEESWEKKMVYMTLIKVSNFSQPLYRHLCHCERSNMLVKQRSENLSWPHFKLFTKM